jgi:hypothetical protein
MLEQETDIDVEPIIDKPSRGERIKRSISARLRRRVAKQVKQFHSIKEEKEARERLHAKRILQDQKRNSV